MRAILVSVDYSDLLAITLPYNKSHFDDICVVTSHMDRETLHVALENKCQVYMTNAFWKSGATFNKWLALEEGLDWFGRHGWMCLMDADVLWPKEIDWHFLDDKDTDLYRPKSHCLYTPMRRMWESWPSTANWKNYFVQEVAMGALTNGGVIPEHFWKYFPLHPQQQEFAGYSQIFHASDPHLGPAPWHEIDWKHAGGADSFFQQKWPESCKVRPPFEVLHLGPAGQNWCGRATPLADGTVPEGAEEKRQQLRSFLRGRTTGPERFSGEKIRKT